MQIIRLTGDAAEKLAAKITETLDALEAGLVGCVTISAGDSAPGNPPVVSAELRIELFYLVPPTSEATT